MYKFKIETTELEYNFADADCVEKYDNTMQKLGSAMDVLPKDVPYSAKIRYICRAIFDVFNTLFGAGTDKKIFGDVCDMNICNDALEQLILAAQAADEENAKRFRSKAAKYTAVK